MASSNLISLSGKTVLITGASSGIGWACSILFKKLGATLLVTGRNEQRLLELSEKLKNTNGDGKVHYVVADLAVENDVKNIVEELRKTYGKLDVLINNAGILEMGTISDTSLDSYDRVMNVNLRSVFQLTNLSVPFLEQTKGCVVNVSSVNGIRSFPGVLAYNISKAGLDQLTRCAALELAPKGIRVNSVNPGVIVTDIHRRAGLQEKDYASFLEHCKMTHPLGHVGSVDEAANAIAFLASDASSFSTGVTLPVDGGRHAAGLR